MYVHVTNPFYVCICALVFFFVVVVVVVSEGLMCRLCGVGILCTDVLCIENIEKRKFKKNANTYLSYLHVLDLQ